MQNMNILLPVIELLIIIVSFCIGRYILPKYKSNIKTTNDFALILNYAESFCAYARQFLTNYSGSEKMNIVVEKLDYICKKQGINIDEEILRAIAQKAYDAMIAGEKSSKNITEATTEKEISDNID